MVRSVTLLNISAAKFGVATSGDHWWNFEETYSHSPRLKKHEHSIVAFVLGTTTSKDLTMTFTMYDDTSFVYPSEGN